jgi:hypothetical protein
VWATLHANSLQQGPLQVLLKVHGPQFNKQAITVLPEACQHLNTAIICDVALLNGSCSHRQQANSSRITADNCYDCCSRDQLTWQRRWLLLKILHKPGIATQSSYTSGYKLCDRRLMHRQRYGSPIHLQYLVCLSGH